MNETKEQRIARLIKGLNEALTNSHNRIIVIVEGAGMTVNGVSKYRYTFLVPEGDRTYDFTAQASALLGYRYSVKNWTCVGQDNSTEMKLALCFALGRDAHELYCDFVYREVWHNPMDNWVKKD